MGPGTNMKADESMKFKKHGHLLKMITECLEWTDGESITFSRESFEDIRDELKAAYAHIKAQAKAIKELKPHKRQRCKHESLTVAHFEYKESTVIARKGDYLFPRVRLLAWDKHRSITIDCNGDKLTFLAWSKAQEWEPEMPPEPEPLTDWPAE